jgi:hypothetical protein
MIGLIEHLQVVATNNYNTIADCLILQTTRAHSVVFSVCYKTFPGVGSNNGYFCASGSSPLFTDSHIEKIFNWPNSESESHITTDGQPASLRLTTRFLLLLDFSGSFYKGLSLWREDGSVIYYCSWPSPEQLFLGPSPVGLVTIFYCLRFETSIYVASYDSRGCGERPTSKLHPAYNPSTRTTYKTQLFYRCKSTVDAESCLPRRCVATAARTAVNTASNSSSVVTCWFVAVGTCLFAIAT